MMKQLITFFLGLLACLMLGISCKPTDILETTGKLSGRVTESGSNKPLANAVISITGQSYTTGADGTFVFNDLPEDEYSVEVSLLGYKTEKKQYLVRAGKETKADFSLEPQYTGIQVSTQSLDFGTTLDVLTFEIIKPDRSGSLEWEIVKQANANWITFSDNHGKLKAPKATISVYLNRKELTEDNVYTTEIIVKTKNGGATRIRVSAQKKGPILSADPGSLDFGSAESEKTLLIKNLSEEGTINFKAKGTESWITLENAEGTISKTDVATIKVRVNRLNLPAGAYNGSIIISSNRNTVTVPVSINVLGKQRPEVGNIQSSEIKHTSFNVSAYIASVGSAAVTSYGFCWSKDKTQPTTADNKNNFGGTTVAKSFNSTITGLLPKTAYYVRAYAINEEGISYSDPLQIETLAPPTYPVVRTLAPVKVESDMATIKGSIDDLGDGYVTSYGFCYSTSNPNPTLSDKSKSIGSSTNRGEFEGEITGLMGKTTYFVRAYATNSLGTAYGGTIQITTRSAAPIINEGLLAYYTFDDQNCDDALGEENHQGILQGEGGNMSFVKDTPSGSGYALKGSDGGKYFRIAKSPDINQRNITFSLWVKTKASNTTFYRMIPNLYSNLARGVFIHNSKIGYLDHTDFNIDVSGLLLDGKWHHFSIVLLGNEATLYIDGRFYDSRYRNAYGNLGFFSTLGYHNGVMDNLRIYNRALSQDEIRQLYNAKQ